MFRSHGRARRWGQALVISLLISGCSTGGVNTLVMDRSGRVRVSVERVAGQKDGAFTLYDANGGVRCKGWYENDHREHWWHRYHDNGAIASLQHYVDGRKDGIQCYWTAAGRLLRTERFTAGEADGPLIKFFPDGSPELWSRFRHGVQEGPHYHWFREDDKPSSFLMGSFVDGLSDGHWIEQRADGHINWESVMDRGRTLRKTVNGKRVR